MVVDACVVYWTFRGHFGEIAGKNNMVRPLFLSPFLFSRNSKIRFWGSLVIFGIFGLGWLGILGQPPCPSHVGVEVLNVGSWLTHGDLALGARVDFLAVVEHRLIPARVRSEWVLGLGEGVVFHLGSSLLRIPPMLVMLGLVLSVCGVLLLLFLPLLLPSLRGSLIAVGRLGVCFLLVWEGSCT